MTTQEFTVGSRLRLILTDVTAAVRVRRGDPGTARVEVTGPAGYPETVSVSFDATDNRLEIREQPGGGVTVVSSGGVVTSGTGHVVVGSGAAVVSGGSVIGARTVTSGPGGVTVVTSSTGRVVVNGVDVTEQVSGGTADPAPALTVLVPEGTDTGAERCTDLTLTALRGRVRAVVAGHSRVAVSETTGARLTIAGQSRATLHRGSGPAEFAISGQSSAEAEGDFGDVRVDLSGQSRLVGTGTFGQVTGEATGMARVELRGAVAGHSIRTSGMARVIFGDPVPRPTGDDWDF